MKKELRLKKNEDFSLVFEHGKAYSNRQLVLYVKDDAPHSSIRVGITVGKKVGNAVTRNRIKRLIRTLFQKYEKQLLTGKDYVMIARKSAVTMDFWQLEKSFLHILRKAHVLRK